MNRWLCHPAVIPIPTTVSGEIREYLSSDILGSVNVGVTDRSTIVTDVQPMFDTLVAVLGPQPEHVFEVCLPVGACRSLVATS